MARITGVFGAVYTGAVGDSNLTKTADVYDWVFDTTVEVLPCDIKSDKYHKFALGAAGAKFTAKRRLESTSFFSHQALLDAATTNVPTTAGAQLLFRLDLIDNNSSFAQITGQGFVSAGSLTNPQDSVDDSIEVTFDGIWTQT